MTENMFTHNKKTLKLPKGVIRLRKSKDRQHNGQKKKGQTTISKTIHNRLLKIEEH